MVVAAGNYGRINPTVTYGYETITAPGNDLYVVTVGGGHCRRLERHEHGKQGDDVIASYSSKGPTSYDLIATRPSRLFYPQLSANRYPHLAMRNR